MTGGASASDQSKRLRAQSAQAQAARAAGQRVQRGKSATSLNKDAKAWQAGAVGEQRVARALNRLVGHQGWVLHDRLLDPAKRWNLDHLVVVPHGVFFVDSKNWKGDLTVFKGALWRHWYAGPKSGRKSEDMTREVLKVKGMADQASARLGHPVVPVICLAGKQSRQFEGVQVVSGVRVVSVDTIVGWLRDSPPRLPDRNLPMLADLAGRLFPPATPEGEDDDSISAQMRRDFAALRQAPAQPRQAPAPAATSVTPPRNLPAAPATEQAKVPTEQGKAGLLRRFGSALRPKD